MELKEFKKILNDACEESWSIPIRIRLRDLIKDITLDKRMNGDIKY